MITIARLPRPEPCGDWHDPPVKWIVSGPGIVAQKFSTKKDAELYKRCLRKTATQAEASRLFILS